MPMLNINKFTIGLNLIALLFIIFYVFLNFEKISVKNIPKNKKVINNNLELIKFKKVLSLEKVELPELINENLNTIINKPIDNSQNEIKPYKLVPIRLIKENLIRNKNKIITLKPIIEENKPILKKNKDLELTPIKYLNNKKDIIKLVNSEDDSTKKKIIADGKELLKNYKNKYQIEFLWPLDNFAHDKIYNILNHCLLSQTVLMTPKGLFFGLNGVIHRNILKNNFSNIIRMPTNVYSELEKKNIQIIKKKYIDPYQDGLKHLRIFKKNVDAYIIGHYSMLAKKNGLKIRKIKGDYRIINNNLYLDNLIINSKKFPNKIPLSSLNNNCNI